MNAGPHWQLWVVAVCVGLALAYTVWAGVRKVRRVQAGGAACGGCSGDACGSAGGGGSGGGGCPSGSGGNTPSSTPAVQAQPIHWHPRAGRSRPPPPST